MYGCIGSNDRVIVDALETTTLVMDHVNQDLQGDHNGGVDELCGLGNFQKNNLPMFKGRYDPEGVQTWIQELRKNYRVITCTDAQKVLFRLYMLFEEVEYWWENTR